VIFICEAAEVPGGKGAVYWLHASNPFGDSHGEQGEDLCAAPCPRNGCFGGLYDENAQLLFLGATLKTNTFIYSIEEWLNIPDRINPQSKKIKLLFEDDDVKEIDFYGHYSTRGDDSIGEYIFMSCSLVKLNREVFQTGLVGLILYFYTITFSLEQIISINLFSDRLIHLSFRKISCL